MDRRSQGIGILRDNYLIDVKFGVIVDVEASRFVRREGYRPHIPVFHKSKRDDGTFSRGDFRYHCPDGKPLGTSGTVHEGKTLLYRASKLDCDVDVCPLKPQCCPKDPSRKIPRDIHERARTLPARLRTLKPSSSPAAGARRSRCGILKLGRLRLRGPRGAEDEFVLAAIAQNLRRLASLVARPPAAADL
jgi:hypothetical protein